MKKSDNNNSSPTSLHHKYELLMKKEVERFEEASQKGEPFELELMFSPAQSEEDALATSAALKEIENRSKNN
jgi:hypothetical protein